MRIEFRAIHLKCLHPRVVSRPDLDTIVEPLLGRVAKPHPQSLFRQLFVPEIVRESKYPGQETTAHFRRRFTNFAIELGVLCDDEHARGGMLSLNQHRRGRAGERTADDYYIVRIHRPQTGWTLLVANAMVFPQSNDLQEWAFDFSEWHSRRTGPDRGKRTDHGNLRGGAGDG